MLVYPSFSVHVSGEQLKFIAVVIESEHSCLHLPRCCSVSHTQQSANTVIRCHVLTTVEAATVTVLIRHSREKKSLDCLIPRVCIDRPIERKKERERRTNVASQAQI